MLEFLRSLVLSQEDQGAQGIQESKAINISRQSTSVGSVQGVLCAIQSTSLNEPLSRCKTMSNNITFRTAGGRIQCAQCQAKSKRTGFQCRAPAIKGKRVCRSHGARGGPKTNLGRQRCAAAKTVHGNETTSKRLERSEVSARLAVLEMVGHSLGFMHGPRTRGRKPNRMNEAYPEFQLLMREILGNFKSRSNSKPMQNDHRL